MTADEIKSEILLILDQLPENRLFDLFEHLKKAQYQSKISDIANQIIADDDELLRRLAD